MRIALVLAITLGAFAFSPILTASTEPAAYVRPHHHHHKHRHAVERAPHTAAQPAPVVVAPGPSLLRPYPPGEGGTDGLSRDPEDCDKGCIGGNPG